MRSSKGLSRFIAVLVLGHPWLLAAGMPVRAQDQAADQNQVRDNRLSLADLAGYRAALSGKAIADDARSSDPPAEVGFRDLWDRPEAFRGRRVTIQGLVARVFRQGPVGSFPPLAEVWIASPVGDLTCLVFPPAGPITGGSPGQTGQVTEPAVPHPGRKVRFTGTFLKTVRYTAGDGARLAPLLVGDRPPVRAPIEAEPGSAQARSAPAGAEAILRAIGGGSDPGAANDNPTWPQASWPLGLALAILAAAVLARQHWRAALGRGLQTSPDRRTRDTTPDPPLQFLDPQTKPRYKIPIDDVLP